MMSAVGDAVHVLPLVNAIKRQSPSSRISWVLQPGPASLVRGHPAIDEIILFDRARGTKAYSDVRAAMTQPFDLLLNLQVYFKAGLVTLLAPAAVKLGFDFRRARDFNWLFTNRKIPAGPNLHVQDQYLEFLDAIGVPSHPLEWHLGPWPDERQWQRRFLAPMERPIASLVIGTSNPQKDWIGERWARVVDILYEDHGLQPVLAGGRSPRELDTERVILEGARHRPVSTLGIPLRELVGVLDASAVVVSLDTGPLHMSVALNRPVVSLMGYNNPKRVGPYRQFHDLMIDAYGEPGEDYAISPAHRHDRMSRITVEDVAQKLGVWAQRYR
ncbi:MAG: glycosyltransferase family 9 protein, partial [Gemmatimonadaceae bacterium]